jgi:hypothetical protein
VLNIVKNSEDYENTYDDLFPSDQPILTSNPDKLDSGYPNESHGYPYDDPFAAILNPNPHHENLYKENMEERDLDIGYPDAVCSDPHDDPYSKEASLEPSHQGG